MAKRTGDYSTHFMACWEQDLTDFIRRDRVHPSVIMWSTGNEIPERGGLNNGYTLATKLANAIRSLDPSRPISNAICSFWSGLDDFAAKGQNQSQNAKGNKQDTWETRTEPFTNGLDIVGYNYMEELYDRDHELYPERVILGSENFPQEIGFRWPVVEANPYIIGDFTWTAWDYIGEAGIGKVLYVDKTDPLCKRMPWEVMPAQTTYYPWRTADDADYDITGRLLAQGAYRSVVWGSDKTYLYSFHPSTFGKKEVMSMWGFPAAIKCWNYKEYETKPVEVIVFSRAEEVEIIVNGKILERKAVVKDGRLPNSVRFQLSFEEGTIEAVSYTGGKEVSRDLLTTSKKPANIRLTLEKPSLKADGHDMVYVNIDVIDSDGRLVPDANIPLTATVEGTSLLAGFGTGNPVTDEDYTQNTTTTYMGHASAIIRSGYEEGDTLITVSCPLVQEKVCVKSKAK